MSADEPRPHAYTINGGTMLELEVESLDAAVTPLHRMSKDFYAYSIWRQPEGVEWGSRLPEGWPSEYLQSAGTAEAMSVEIRRLKHGVHRQYAIGRNGERVAPPAEVIVWGPNSRRLSVYSDEIFGADEAAAIYLHYCRTGGVPGAYSLRLLDLTYPPVDGTT